MTAPAAIPSRRTRQKQATRRRLLAAAGEKFAEDGYHATRPQDIARAAGFSSGTFYVHFSDKADAFCAFTEQAADELMDHVRERALDASAGFEGRFHASLSAIFDYIERHPGAVSAAFADANVIAAGVVGGRSLRDRLAANLANALRDGMARRELFPDYDADVIANGIVGLVQQAARNRAARGDHAHTIQQLVRFVGRALVQRPEENP